MNKPQLKSKLAKERLKSSSLVDTVPRYFHANHCYQSGVKKHRVIVSTVEGTK